MVEVVPIMRSQSLVEISRCVMCHGGDVNLLKPEIEIYLGFVYKLCDIRSLERFFGV